MKPIQLSWSGLQSYREKQEIDFTLLCDAGVFGIFGPTGSGKSTILDAITLALYGKVERASNGTQGILNQAENILTVSFTFELSHAEGSKRYRVERQFKRAADVSVTNTICRLIQIQTEQDSVVLADKGGEVNAQILQILGLSMQDFSRAVVLPQGKFAEFLSLTGKDRRQMLQRLFHLEQYGDVLTARVRQRSEETDIAMKQIIAEQQGLGDASEQALLVAKQQADEAKLNAKQQRIQLQQASLQWEEMKQLRSLEQEKHGVETNRFDLALQEERIAKQEQRLKLADQAGRVRHFLQEYEETNQQAQALVLEQEQLAKRYNEAAEQTEKVVNQHAQAKNELSTQDAPLQVRLEKLNQAVLLEQEIQKGAVLASELSDKLERNKEQLAFSQLELLNKQDTYARALKKQADLNEQLKALEVKAEYRQSLQKALREKQALDATRLKVNDLMQQTNSNQQQLEAETNQEIKITRQLNENQTQLITLLQSIEGHALTHSFTELGLENLSVRMSNSIEERKQTEKVGELERYIIQLATQLQLQQPCPVCGSTEHPSPMAAITEESKDSMPTSHELEQLGLLQTKLQQLQLNHQKQALQQNALEQKIVEAIPNANRLDLAEAAAARSQAPITQAKFDSLNQLEEQYISFTGQIQLAGQQITQLTEEIKQTLLHKDHLIQQKMAVSAQIQAIQAIYNGLEVRLAEVKSEYELQHKQWLLSYTAFNLEAIQLESDKLNEQDQAVEQLRLRLEQSVPFIEEIQREVNQRLQEQTELDKYRIQLETEQKGLLQLNMELQTQFKKRWEQEINEGGTIEERIRQTAQLLNRLRETERHTQQQMEQFQMELVKVNEQYISIRQAADSAQQAFLRAEQFWLEALKNTSFSSADEVRKAWLNMDQIEAWHIEVSQHREQEARLRAKLEELLSKLDGRSISEAQWLEMELMLSTSKETDERALQEQAKADRDLEQLQSKHIQWCDLEHQLKIRKQEFTDLSKLQSVLRGNAFVEYIAEEQLIQVCRVASERLGQLTRQRYALEVDSSGGFVIRDDANGGVRRPVGTLSGGETFLTSLALALALSAQIQLSGQYPLEFFFLDEGFGTLDPELLETVVEALEKLHIDRLTVGIISHVPELKARLPRKLIVESAEPGGRGSRVFIEGL